MANRVLVVEDDENKAAQLVQLLKAFPSLVIDPVGSLHAAIRSLHDSGPPDLVVLDMTIPTYSPGPEESGGETHPFGGREFLRELDRLEIETPVIVVTQFSVFGATPNAIGIAELDQELRKEHGNVYSGIVYYDSSMQKWREELRRLVESATGTSAK